MLNTAIKAIVNNVYDVMYKGAYSSIIADRLMHSQCLSEGEKSYISVVSYGVIENWIRLEYYITKLVKKEPKKNIKIILLSALYEMKYMDNNADYITVNSYVDYTSRVAPHAKHFVNAVLREFIRRDKLCEYDVYESIEDMSRYFSHPVHLVHLLIEQYGREQCMEILAENQRKSSIYLRVNQKKITRENLIGLLLKEGFELGDDPLCDNAIAVKSLPSNIISYKSYKSGYYYIQDIASIAMINAVEIKGDELVLDVAAAPGGKALGVAEKLTTGKIVAEDIYPKKLHRLVENANRLGIEIEVNVSDATVYKEKYSEKFDVVIADVPCSGLGVISKKPEIKYRNSTKKLEDMVKLQYHILENVSNYVKRGGVMYYSTCTINVNENEDVISRFLSEHDDFCIEPVTSCFGNGNPYLKLLQSNKVSDGFFIARLKKNKY